MAWEAKLQEEIAQQLEANKALYAVFDEAFEPVIDAKKSQLITAIDEYQT